eukprot:15030344-Alexandrium_andersonii.AAC.1
MHTWDLSRDLMTVRGSRSLHDNRYVHNAPLESAVISPCRAILAGACCDRLGRSKSPSSESIGMA